jgi:UDP-glucose:(heptosyl)LPS alpha-1,3-glucosyltransferase
VTRLGLGSCVRFEDFVVDLRAHYAAADVFVLPTYYDACSLTVLEASACGLPAITTAWNGAAELMTHGKDGFVIPEPDAIADLTRAMDTCMDPAVRDRIAPAARALGVRSSIDRNIEAIEALYLEMAVPAR